MLTVPAPEALLLHHAYGTNGIITEVELALAPAHQWIERLDVFDDFADALNYANACVRSPGLVKRQVALLATPIADYFSHLNDRYRAGQHAVISLIAEESEGLCASLLPRHRGSNAIRQASEEARTRNGSLMEYCWNHTTLHALKVDNTLTYLQTAFDPLRYPQQILQMEQHFAGEVMSHIEFLRDIEGNLTASGLQLVRYTTPERLNAIMQIFRDNDVKINNPHVLQVEDGKQGVIRPDVVAVKQSLDPAGLLNPGRSCAAGRCATSWNWTATRWRGPPAKAPRPDGPRSGWALTGRWPVAAQPHPAPDSPAIWTIKPTRRRPTAR